MAEFNKLVVFDCDGTLVDSQHMIIDAMRATYDQLKLPQEDEMRVRSIIGLSLVEAMAMLRPDDERAFHEEMAEIYKREFYRLRVDEAIAPEPLFPGTLEILETLNNAGFLLGVATGKSHRGLIGVIKEHGLEDTFITLQTADNHPSKPHPSMIHTAMADAGASPETTLMVGDTSYDMMMARSARVCAVGVKWGYHSEHELRDGGAHHLLDSYDPLHGIAENWGSDDDRA